MSLISRLRALWRSPPPVDLPFFDEQTEEDTVLSRARSHWEAGEWSQLINQDPETVQYHPDRARLAVLIMSGHQNLGHELDARQWADRALAWGISKQQLIQILVADLESNLGRISVLLGKNRESIELMEATAQGGGEDDSTSGVAVAGEGEPMGIASEEPLVMPGSLKKGASKPPSSNLNGEEVTETDLANLERLGL